MDEVVLSSKNKIVFDESGQCFFEVAGSKGVVQRWRITPDVRTINNLKSHVAEYGNFYSNGAGKGGGLKGTLYRLYRPYGCSNVPNVYTVDGDEYNLMDSNLYIMGDTLPITDQRRIWHDEYRIFIKKSNNPTLFFTEYMPELFMILCSTELNGWYIQQQERKTKSPVKRLYCRAGGKPVAFAELIWLYDSGQIDTSDLTASILRGKETLRSQSLEVDHLRDNRSNNCAHNLIAIPGAKNGVKSDRLTEINAPYYFVPVRVRNTFRVACGKASNDSHKWIICFTYDEFHDFLEKFHKCAMNAGDMTERYDDPTKTRCVSEMLQDDGRAYQDNQPNPIEVLLHMAEGQFVAWDGDLTWLQH